MINEGLCEKKCVYERIIGAVQTMKIVIISPKNKTVFNFRGDLVKHMISFGNTVVVTGPNQDHVDEILALGVSKFIEVPLVKDNTSVIGDLIYCWRLRKVIKTESPDLVFGYTIKPVIYGSIAARTAGVKKIYAMVTGLGRIYTSNGLKTRMVRFITDVLYKTAFWACDKVIFQNNDDLKQFVSCRYLHEKKAVKVDGSGVNMEQFFRMDLPGSPVFLMVGRIIREKGVMEYCKAARVVKEKYPHVKFILLGGFDTSFGALKQEDLQPYIDDGSVEFPGEVKNPLNYYHDSSVFVLPSYYREGLPRTILEAMSCGRAVITTNWPGCRDAVDDGENGFLIHPKDAKELSMKMIQLIEDKRLLRQMSEKSYQKCRKTYEVSIINQKMREIIGY